MNFDLSQIKAVLFDWDNTLIDSIPFIQRANNHMRQQIGLGEMSEEEFNITMHHSAQDSFPILYGEKAEHALFLFRDYVNKNHISELKPLKGAEELLQFLFERDIKLAVVTNKRAIIAKPEAEKLKWDKYFSVIIGAGDAPYDKPNKAPIEFCLKKLGIEGLKAQEILYIGDSDSDILCSQAANVPMAVVENNNNVSRKNINADHIILKENSTLSLFKKIKSF